jgi:asparagine synthetase B (glutamine-hydrolysing)
MRIAHEFRERMIRAVEPHVGRPLAYSGGVDSSTVLAAFLEIGFEPELYTFKIPGVASADYESAVKVAEDFNLTLHTVDLPADRDEIVKDIRSIFRTLERNDFAISKAKVYVQCASPFIHLSKAALKNDHDVVIFAMLADDLYGCGREDMILMSKQGEAVARESRRKTAYDTKKLSDNIVAAVAKENGVRLIDPFRSDHVRDFMIDLDIAIMNKPKPKQLAIDAFPEFFAKYYRRPSPLQVAGGIRDYHAKIFLPDVEDSRAQKQIASLYRSIANGTETLFETRVTV